MRFLKMASKKPTAVSIEDLAIVPTNAQSIVETYKNFNTLSILSLAVSLMATWEGLLSTFGQGLNAAGPVSLVYGFIVAFIGSTATAASLSEPASRYPTAGGQYHFMAMLSSDKHRPWLSWYAGWLTILGWLALTASAPFAGGTLIQGLVTLNYPDYVPERWHGTLLYLAILAIAFALNLWGSKLLPLIENLIMALHILFFFAILIAVAVLPRNRNSASFVFTNFQNNTGWESDGIAWCIGLLTSAYITVGYDSAAHMCEEMKNPTMGVPRAMIGSLLINCTMGFAVLIAVLFGMGDINEALASPTGFPIITVFTEMTRGNTSASSAMVCTIIISASLATVGLIASTSRSLWAFARDDAPPFSPWLARLDKKRHTPSNAVICCSVFLALLGLLNIASTTAFTAILSLTVISLSLSYVLPIIAMLYRRVANVEKISFGPWRMSPVLGTVLNIVAISYNIFLCIFLLLPPIQPVTAQNMNYASAVLGGVLVFITVDWFIRGRKVYSGPQYL
uniref:Amino acid permease/ SLC12A domain-containing protein n=2 Tax=Bionectria ochroleuca TaxID=29856 RepID=A0A8H7N224_BIOOC